MTTHAINFQPQYPATSALEITDAPADLAQDLDHIRKLARRMRRESSRVLGFPGPLIDFRDMADVLGVFFNNVGDPTSADRTAINTKPHEQHVVHFLARLAGADPDRTYGYVTASGTEGNLFGVALGRSRLPRAPVYASKDAHYALRKVADLLRIELVQIPTMPDGGMDPQALHDACAARRGRGAIVVATIGTTMRGAVGDLYRVREAATAAGHVHVHVDGALGGWVAPFSPNRPPFGFDAGADSLTFSGHKLIGLPVPAAVALARRDLVTPASAGEYLGASDATLGCSRSGLAALLLWAALRRLGRDGLAARVRACLHTAAFAEQRLTTVGRRPWRHPDSITVTFDRPSAQICQRWHLAVEGSRAHIVCVPHVLPADQVAALCRDLASTPYRPPTDGLGCP